MKKGKDFIPTSTVKRVAFYTRITTDDTNSDFSYESLSNYYTDMVNSHADWSLIDIYIDEQTSDMPYQHREALNKLIADCKSGKIDLIVAKSVSCFSRNVLECIDCVRKLASMQPPVCVYFEMEDIATTLDFKGDIASFYKDANDERK